MDRLARFSVSIDSKLLEKFDEYLKQEGYPTRSKAVSALITDALVREEWESSGENVPGVVTMVYDHHKRGISERLIGIQHDYYSIIVSSQHIHLDEDNCLEVVITRGEVGLTRAFARDLKSVKGIKYVSFSLATTGRGI